jgi:predicted CXXCH cytochrome family protein
MRRNTLFTVLAMPAVALMLTVTSCTDETIVYRDRDLFEAPPTGAASFLGYSNAEDKLTVCGNCHIGAQVEWQGTAHADAWAGLQESGHAQAFCEGCHTVGQLGNTLATAGGWEATKDDRYKDVQCESCHGPGLGHVQNPSKGTVGLVLASMAAGTVDGDGVIAWQGCAECHQGTHHPYGEEWIQSGHGGGNAWKGTSAGGRAECVECHTAENALVKLGVSVNYAEKAGFIDSHTTATNMPITCGVCHDPHSAGHPGQIRKSLSEADLKQNLCMSCHYKRGVPDPTTFRGPHSPEGPVLVGEGGYWPQVLKDRFPTGRVEATHGAPSANPKLCAGCHMNRFEYTDELGVHISGTGHTFEATPCVTPGGAPIVNGDCTQTERSFKSCTSAGCHGSEGAARSAVITAQLRISNLVTDLDNTLAQIAPNWKACRSATIRDGSGATVGYGNCPDFNGAPSPLNWSLGDPMNTARGAAFNYDMGVRTTTVIHNPFLIEQLLISSIQQLRIDYNLPAGAVRSDLTPQFSRQ